MQSAAATVEAYLAELPEDRREAIEAIRKVILKNLPKGYEEGMLYGMIGYYVPHSIYPDGYHCTPTDPLPFAGGAPFVYSAAGSPAIDSVARASEMARPQAREGPDVATWGG